MTKLYSLLPEHEARFPEWRDRWIANAMSTAAMTEEDREICRTAVHGLYAAANLPAPKHIVFVPSPFVLAFAGGFAAAIWHMHKTGFRPASAAVRAARSATDSATDSAIDSATYRAARSATDSAARSATVRATVSAIDSATVSAIDSATVSATYRAARSATYRAARSATDSATVSAIDSATDSAARSATVRATVSAIDSATVSAIDSATVSATYRAARSATDSAIDSATRSAIDSATVRAARSAADSAARSAADSAARSWYVLDGNFSELADAFGIGEFGFLCANNYYNMWQGGNQWSAWDSFLTFFQDVAQLPIDYSKYNHWRVLSEHSGPRIMHPDFCMICDRPELLTVDEANRPHGESGPFCRWRDGSALYMWHGTPIPADWIENRAALDPLTVLQAQNVEARAAGLAILGARMIPALIQKRRAKWLKGAGAWMDRNGNWNTENGSADLGGLLDVKLPGLPQPGRYLVAHCPRNGAIMEGVPFVSDIDGLPIETAIAAQAWRIGDPQSEYVHPPRRT